VFNIGSAELFVILAIALIALGPDKLPGIAHKLGNIVGELRRMSNGLQPQRLLTDAFKGEQPDDDDVDEADDAA
jgi:Sec-independent protein translocase protein TatA